MEYGSPGKRPRRGILLSRKRLQSLVWIACLGLSHSTPGSRIGIADRVGVLFLTSWRQSASMAEESQPISTLDNLCLVPGNRKRVDILGLLRYQDARRKEAVGE